MLRRTFLASILIALPCTVQGEEGIFGKEEFFGQNGKLYAVERSGSDTLRYYLLRRRLVSGEDGSYYDGRIRIVTDIEGGGYTIEETSFFSHCHIMDQPDNVIVTLTADNGTSNEFKIVPSRKKVPLASRSNYNLWWATCKDQFQKFK